MSFQENNGKHPGRKKGEALKKRPPKVLMRETWREGVRSRYGLGGKVWNHWLLGSA